jgi:hypothetical protein
MLKEAIFAETRGAIITIKLVAVANVMPAFTAFYGSIDELKHQTFRYSERTLENTHIKRSDTCNADRCGLACFH